MTVTAGNEDDVRQAIINIVQVQKRGPEKGALRRLGIVLAVLAYLTLIFGGVSLIGWGNTPAAQLYFIAAFLGPWVLAILVGAIVAACRWIWTGSTR